MSEAAAQMRLQASIAGLADRVPLVSARSLVTRGQRNVLIGLLFVLVVAAVINVRFTVTVLIGLTTLCYLVAVVYRSYLFTRSSKVDALEIVTDEEALYVPDDELPSYTIMIPAYREASVIKKLIGNLTQLDYPTDRLEVLILVEGDDDETLTALRDASPPSHFRLVVIPPAEPRTKPKALNFGLTLARGDIVAVFDVEDTPDVLQLRRAAVVLSRYGPEVGCVQAKLSYSNSAQNMITRWFTIEYAMWFSFFLPGLSSLGAPIPLGGTSNHFRRSVLRDLGGWDPFNVTEDCDLGIRMFRERYDIKVVESTTLEEANSDFVNLGETAVPLVQGLPADLSHPPARSPDPGQGDPAQRCPPPLCVRGWHSDSRCSEPDLLGDDRGLVRCAARSREADISRSGLLRGTDPLGLWQLPSLVSDRTHGAPRPK